MVVVIVQHSAQIVCGFTASGGDSLHFVLLLASLCGNMHLSEVHTHTHPLPVCRNKLGMCAARFLISPHLRFAGFVATLCDAVTSSDVSIISEIEWSYATCMAKRGCSYPICESSAWISSVWVGHLQREYVLLGNVDPGLIHPSYE